MSVELQTMYVSIDTDYVFQYRYSMTIKVWSVFVSRNTVCPLRYILYT